MNRFVRKHATTLVLSTLALFTGAAGYVLDRGSVTTSEAEQRKQNLLPSFRGSAIQSLRVEAHGRAATLTRGPESDTGQRPWQVEIDGARYAAEEPFVDQYLGALEMGTVLRRVPEEAIDRKAFGLTAPRLEATIVMGPVTYTLRLGGPAPTPAEAIYAEIEGHGVSVISKQLTAALEVAPGSFRSRSFVPSSLDELASISLEGEGGPRRLVRSADAPIFRLEGGDGGEGGKALPPNRARVGRAAEETLALALGQMRADAYLTADEAERTLDRKITLLLTPRDPARGRTRIEAGGPCPGHPDDIVAVRREPDPAFACIPAGVLEPLSQPADALVDLKIIGATADQVIEIKLTGEGLLLELARMGPGFHLRAPKDRGIDAETGRALLEGLLSVEAERLEPQGDPRTLGLDPPRAVLRVTSVVREGNQDRERIETLEIGESRKGSVRVRRVEDGMIAVLSEERAASLLPSEIALRPKKLFEEDPKSIKALRIESNGHTQRLERDAEGRFRLLEPEGPGLRADEGLAEELSEALATLSVERWVADRGSGYGLDKPRLILEAKLAPGADAGPSRALRVSLGAPTSNGFYAQSGGEQAIFLAPRSLAEAAGKLLLDRTQTALEPEGLKRATLTGDDGKRLVLEQSGDVFRLAGVPVDPVSTAKAAAVRDALSALVAESAISLGKPDKNQGFERPRLTIVAETQAEAKPVRIVLGAGDTYQGMSVVYARREGVDATYVIAQGKVKPLFEALAGL